MNLCLSSLFRYYGDILVDDCILVKIMSNYRALNINILKFIIIINNVSSIIKVQIL